MEQRYNTYVGNGIGVWTLYRKEVLRFVKVFSQTIIAPSVTTLLFLAIFTLALGSRSTAIDTIPFVEFLAPGLIMMAMVQNSFANTSSSLMIAKVQKNIVDILMPPLSASELTLGFALAAITRGLTVGLFVGLVMAFFVPLKILNFWVLLFYAINASMMLGLLGIIGGIWSIKFDHIAAFTNFFITPLSFLSGTFYSINRLPDFWQYVALANPFFYMIDGFRYGMIGYSDAPLWIGALVLMGTNIGLWLLSHWMFETGYRLKN